MKTSFEICSMWLLLGALPSASAWMTPLLLPQSRSLAPRSSGSRSAAPWTRHYSNAAGNNGQDEGIKQNVLQDMDETKEDEKELVFSEEELLQQQLEMMMFDITGNPSAANDDDDYEALNVIPIPRFTAAVVLMGSLYVTGYGFYVGLMGFPDDDSVLHLLPRIL